MDPSAAARAQQYEHLQQMETAADVSRLKHLTATKKILYKSWYFWVIVLGGLATWIIGKLFYVRSKYRYIISQMTQAIKDGSKFPISPFFVALSLEYPFLSSFRIGNPSLPFAISYAYTSSDIAPIMGTGYVKDCTPPRDWLNAMYEISQDCGYRLSDSGQCSSLFIICSLFRECDRADCFKPCPVGSQSSDAEALGYVSSIAGSGASWGMAGSLLGPVGFGLGIVGGGLFGFFSHSAAEGKRKKQCDKIRANCYLPKGQTYNCPLPPA